MLYLPYKHVTHKEMRVAAIVKLMKERAGLSSASPP
jgi:hypothetical protein